MFSSYLGFGEDAVVWDCRTASYGVTRTSAGFMALGRDLDDSIIVVGNAPSAALTVYELIKEGACPALVIGTPVGFVNAADSKELLRSLDVPSITCTGTRGGTPVAVACMNELIAITAQEVGGGGHGISANHPDGM